MEIENNLSLKYEECNRAILTLNNSINLLKRTDEISKADEYLAFQDSVIQRFEYSLDIIWKYLKDYIQKKHGNTVKSPKETFREAFKQNILNKQESELALQMVDDRNETTHRYDYVKAKEIIKKIFKYQKLLTNILERTKI